MLNKGMLLARGEKTIGLINSGTYTGTLEPYETIFKWGTLVMPDLDKGKKFAVHTPGGYLERLVVIDNGPQVGVGFGNFAGGTSYKPIPSSPRFRFTVDFSSKVKQGDDIIIRVRQDNAESVTEKQIYSHEIKGCEITPIDLVRVLNGPVRISWEIWRKADRFERLYTAPSGPRPKPVPGSF